MQNDKQILQNDDIEAILFQNQYDFHSSPKLCLLVNKVLIIIPLFLTEF